MRQKCSLSQILTSTAETFGNNWKYMLYLWGESVFALPHSHWVQQDYLSYRGKWDLDLEGITKIIV